MRKEKKGDSANKTPLCSLDHEQFLIDTKLTLLLYKMSTLKKIIFLGPSLSITHFSVLGGSVLLLPDSEDFIKKNHAREDIDNIDADVNNIEHFIW